MNTDTLVTHAVGLIKNCKNSLGFSKLSATPSHLLYDIRRIEKQWELRGFISEEDTHYLEHIYASSNEYLKSHVYLLGGWHPWQSRNYASYNLRSQKRLKRSNLRYNTVYYT